MAFMAAIIPMIAAAGGTAAAAGGATAAVGTASSVALAATVLSAGISTLGALKQGRDAKAMAKFQSRQMKANALAETAAGQRRALIARNKSDLLASRALAVAGASGAGTLDPDVLNIISGIHARGEEQFQAENFNAQTQANFLESQAEGTEIEGRNIQTASRIEAATTMLSAAADTGMFFGRARGTGATTDASNRDALNVFRRTTSASRGGGIQRSLS